MPVTRRPVIGDDTESESAASLVRFAMRLASAVDEILADTLTATSDEAQARNLRRLAARLLGELHWEVVVPVRERWPELLPPELRPKAVRDVHPAKGETCTSGGDGEGEPGG